MMIKIIDQVSQLYVTSICAIYYFMLLIKNPDMFVKLSLVERLSDYLHLNHSPSLTRFFMKFRLILL